MAVAYQLEPVQGRACAICKKHSGIESTGTWASPLCSACSRTVHLQLFRGDAAPRGAGIRGLLSFGP